MVPEEHVFNRPKRETSGHAPVLASAGGLFLLLLSGALLLSYQLFQPVTIQKPISLTVREGETPSILSHRLKESGAIRSEIVFQLLYSLKLSGKTIKAGDYTLSGAPTLVQTALLFIQGMPKKERTITIIEGWTQSDIAAYLEAQGIMKAADFMQEVKRDFSDRFSFLPRTTVTEKQSLEGYLFPDTYRIFENASADDIIAKMLDNFQRKYSPDMIAETIKRSRDVKSIVTLASILEREVKNDRDRRIVADIFYRRLARGMPLQADSTINYITGRNDVQARSTDLSIDSPYNTYRRRGLPPGPIGNPGLSALQAALSPIENPFWFFLTTPEGDVVYSKTFEEHVKNKLKYLAKR